jgi:hypothetical protein
VALFVSGVLGGGDPASSPRVAVPADSPSNSAPADVVVVPGAKEASARAVELAKARDRARERAERTREVAPARKPASAKPATPAATPPPPPPPPPAAATPPPPAAPPPPATPSRNANNGKAGACKPKSGGSRKIETGNGATGSEQIPPKQDSSNVPDLAPPPAPATSP